MKTFAYLSAFALIAGICACGGNNQKTVSVDSLTNHIKPGKHCYLAVFEKDSAKLNLDIGTDGEITGKLAIEYSNADTITRQSTHGALVKVAFSGDTLRGDYSFTSGPKGTTQFINPIALLHKGDSLIMGYGTISSYLGRNYFDPARPIGFEKSKFRFAEVACGK